MATATAPLIDDRAFTLIWFDNDTSRVSWYLNAKKRLHSIIDCIETFEEQDRCKDYIQQSKDRCHHVVIIGNEAALQLVSSIHNYAQVVSIYVYDSDPNCMGRYPKVIVPNDSS
jgi:hypothetical protein